MIQTWNWQQENLKNLKIPSNFTEKRVQELMEVKPEEVADVINSKNKKHEKKINYCIPFGFYYR